MDAVVHSWQDLLLKLEEISVEVQTPYKQLLVRGVIYIYIEREREIYRLSL